MVFQLTTRPAVTASILKKDHSIIQAATATVAESSGNEAPLDEFLLAALKNRQDRLFLLRLDREYCNFIGNK
ncbi:hypothetical protein BGZ65_011982, partial [Modicella reniformis]